MAMDSRWAHAPLTTGNAGSSSRMPSLKQVAGAAAAMFRSLPLLRRILLILSALASALLIFNILQFGSNILVWILPLSQVYSETSSGWIGLWVLTVFVAFPPLFGFSSVCALSGFVFGMKGWLVASTATIAGSTITFLIARHLLNNTFKRFVSRDSRFTTLTHLRQPGAPLLSVFYARLCPLPYALSNAAFGSAFPQISWHQYALATAMSTPRLLVHVFIGARLKSIALSVLYATAPGGAPSQSVSPALEYLAVGAALAVGLGLSMFAHRQTARRAAEYPLAAGAHPEFAYEVQDLSLTHPDNFDYDVESNSSEEEGHNNDFKSHAKAKESPAPSPMPIDSETFQKRQNDFFGDGGSSGLAPETGGLASGNKPASKHSHSRERSSSNTNIKLNDPTVRGHSRLNQSIERTSFDIGVRQDDD